MRANKALLLNNMLGEGKSKNMCPDRFYQRPNASTVYIGQDNATDYPFEFKANTQYTLSYLKNGGSGGYATYVGLEGGQAPMAGSTNPITFTVPSDGRYRIALVGATVTELSNVQVEKGSEATPYEPYYENSDFLETYLKLKLIGDC